MKTIKSSIICEQTINKSIFITQLFPINSSEEATQILAQTRKKYHDATHNCYAYSIGSEYTKCSDDGEPSQTAGVVILNVLIKNNITNVLCIVTRYFGGIKLGSGGLVRAYSSSAAMAVGQSEIVEIIEYLTLSFEINYPSFYQLTSFLNQYNVVSKLFLDNVILKIEIPKEKELEVREYLYDVTKNQITFN